MVAIKMYKTNEYSTYLQVISAMSVSDISLSFSTLVYVTALYRQ